jgi:hypothetical protein
MKKPKNESKAKGALALAKSMTPEELKARGQKAALARWGAKPLQATHTGNFIRDFGIDVECYVLNDENKTAVISKRGMGLALGYTEGGSRLTSFIKGKTIAQYAGRELIEKLENPIIFQGVMPGTTSMARSETHGYDVTILIDLCKAIINAESDGKLSPNQTNLAKQAHIILGASAKAGIKGLVYALSGYDIVKEEVITAFKLYVQEEAKKYEPEFPNELYLAWQRLYKITMPTRGKPWQFLHLTRRHIYYPLAKSQGKILELLKALRAQGGEQKRYLFQFLNDIGARALRIHMGRILEMAESAGDDAIAYEGKFNERFGEQQELDFLPKDDASAPNASPQPS